MLCEGVASASKIFLHVLKFVDRELRQRVDHGCRPLLILSPRKAHNGCAIFQHRRGSVQTKLGDLRVRHLHPQTFKLREVFTTNLNSCRLIEGETMEAFQKVLLGTHTK